MDKEHHFDPLMKIQAVDLLIKKKIKDRAFRVFCFLVCRYNTYTMQCNPSVNYMAKEMCKSPSYVKRGLQELREKNLISNRRGSITTGSNLYRLVGTSIGICQPQSSNMHEKEIKFVSKEGSGLSRKYINENIKKNINTVSHYEPELYRGSGSSAISDSEREKAGINISKIINGEVIN